MKILFLVLLVLLVLPDKSALADPPEDYAPPTKVEGTPFYRVHRYDLEGLVADRQALAACKDEKAVCARDLAAAYQQRVDDVTNPNADVWPLWIKGTIYVVGTVIIGIAGKLAGDFLASHT